MDFPGLSWGREKRDLADRWPRNADGVPEKPVFLTRETERNNAAGMLVEMLRAYGVPVMKKYAEDDALGKVIFGTPCCGADLYVPENMLEDAKNLIAPVDEINLDEEDL